MNERQKKTWSEIHSTFCLNAERLRRFSDSDLSTWNGDIQVLRNSTLALCHCRNMLNIERVGENTPQPIQDLFSFPYKWFEFPGVCLDVGCGERGSRGKWIGVDSARLDEIYIRASALFLPFKDKSFSTVSCFETIEHVGDEINQIEVIHEMVRVARQRVVIGSVNRTGYSYVGGIEIYKGQKNPYHTRELDPNDFVDLLSHVGSRISFFNSLEGKTGDLEMCVGLGGLINYGIIHLDMC